MDIHYYNRSARAPSQAQGATYHNTSECLFGVADFVSLHWSASPETTDLMNAERFALLPHGAVIVNTARGVLVDKDALMAALDSGRVAAAGPDCFKMEPGGNPAFVRYNNIFMLPNIGSATKQTRDAMGFRALDNLDAFFSVQTACDTLQYERNRTGDKTTTS